MLPLIFVVGFAEAFLLPSVNPVFDLCKDGNFSNVYNDELITEKLFDWCVNDKRCCADYHQDYRQNFTIFKHLLGPKLKHQGLMGLFIDLLCTEKDLEEINRNLWMSYLSKERVEGAPLCDVNHHLVFNEGELKYECACNSDRACSDQLFDLVLFYIVLGLISFLAILFFCGNINMQRTAMNVLEKATSEKRAAEALKKVLS